MKDFRLIAKKVLLYFFGIWLITSNLILISRNSSFIFFFLYNFYLAICLYNVIKIKKDIFSPIGFVTIWTFLSYGMLFPLLYNEVKLWGKFQIESKTLEICLVIFITSIIAFTFGYNSQFNKYVHLKKLIKQPKKFYINPWILFVLILIPVTLGSLFRYVYKIGGAGMFPTVPFAGIWQFLFYWGNLLLCSFYLGYIIRCNKKLLLLPIILFLIIAVTQALLGWRGGIIVILTMVFFVFWYLLIINGNKKFIRLSFVWIIIVLSQSNFLMDIADSKRSYVYNDSSIYEKFQKRFSRIWGLVRLSKVVSYFGEIKFTNNFNIKNLYSNHISAARFADLNIHKIRPDIQHSVGASGLGGPYISLGLLGVFIAFYFWGFISRQIYSTMGKDYSNTFGVAFYSAFVTLLTNAFQENFGLFEIKTLIFLLIYTLVISRIVNMLRNV